MRKTVDFEFCRLPCRSCGPGGAGEEAPRSRLGCTFTPPLPLPLPLALLSRPRMGVALRVAHTHESPVVWCLCECHVGRFRFCLVVSTSFRGSLG